MSKQTKINIMQQNFLTEIKAATNEHDYQNLWTSVLDKLSDRTNATKAAYASRFRKAIKAEFGDNHPILSFMKLPYTESMNPSYIEMDMPSGDTKKSNAGRKPTRKALINDFVDFIKKNKENKSFTEQLTERWKNEIADMLSEKMTCGSILNAVTKYRKALQYENFDTDAILTIVKAPDEFSQQKNQTYINRIFLKHHKLIAFPQWQKMVEELNYLLPVPSGTWSTFMDEAHRNAKDLKREEAVKIGVLLTLFTGRRAIEIFCQGRFSPVLIPTNNKNTTAYDMWHVNFNGQAKTRGQDGTMFDSTYIIPTLTHSKTILYAHECLRFSKFGLQWQEMTPEEYKADLLQTPAPKCIAPIICDELFKKYWPEESSTSFSNIRTIYAEIASAFFCPKNTTKAAFVAKILGHSNNDLETANSYMKFYLPDITEHGVAQRVKTRFMNRLDNFYKEQKEKYPKSY